MEEEIFKKGSKTYFNASKLFPKNIRQDVAKLYSFVRVVDDYVDAVPQQKAEFQQICSSWEQFKNLSKIPKSNNLTDRVVRNVCEVSAKYGFDQSWVDAFLESMSMDLTKRTYENIEELEKYIYGSAEVIGLMMCRIMDINEKAYLAARAQGKAMQLINFIRDIDEDNGLGRQYLPMDEVQKFGLRSLKLEEVASNTEAFDTLIRFQINRYKTWQKQADEGFEYLPVMLKRAVRVAVDGYNWTAKKIEKNPQIIFSKKIKPSKKYLAVRAARRVA